MDILLNKMDSNWTELSIEGKQQILNNPFVSDLVLEFPKGDLLYVHRQIVYQRSQRLRSYYEQDMPNDKIIIIDEFSYKSWREYIKFLYINNCEIDEEIVQELLCFAIEDSLNELIKLCVDFWLYVNPVELLRFCIKHKWDKEKLRIITYIDENLQDILSIHSLDLLELSYKNTNIILEYIGQNFNDIVSSDKFLCVSSKTLNLILKYDGLLVESEFEVFIAAMRWINYACVKEINCVDGLMKRKLFDSTVYLIRFAAMTAEEFARCIKREPNLLTSDEISAITLKISVSESFSCHFFHEKRTSGRTVKPNVGNLFVKSEIDPLIFGPNDCLIPKNSKLSEKVVNEMPSESKCKCTDINSKQSNINDSTNNTILTTNNTNSITSPYNMINLSLKSLYIEFERGMNTKNHLDGNNYFIYFSVSNSVYLSGVSCYGAPRAKQFYIKEKKKNISLKLLNFTSDSISPITYFEPIQLYKNRTYGILYSVTDSEPTEILSWQYKHKKPWSHEQDGIVFSFLEMNSHIGQIYYKLNLQPKSKSSFSESENTELVLETLKDDLDEKYNQLNLSSSIFLQFETILTPKLLLRYSNYYMSFSVSKPLLIIGLFCYGEPKLTQFHILKKRPELKLKSFTSNCSDPITSFAPIKLEANIKYIIKYTFIDIQTHEYASWQCKEKTPWSVEQHGITFVFYKMSEHIGRIFYKIVNDTRVSDFDDVKYISNCLNSIPLVVQKQESYSISIDSKESSTNISNQTELNSNVISVFLNFKRLKCSKLLNFNIDFLSFTVSEKIIINGILWSDKPYPANFYLENENRIKLLMFQSDGLKFKIIFKQTLLYPGEIYTIKYAVTESYQDKLSTVSWEFKEKIPWSIQKRGIKFKFLKISAHIKCLYFKVPEIVSNEEKVSNCSEAGSNIMQNSSENYINNVKEQVQINKKQYDYTEKKKYQNNSNIVPYSINFNCLVIPTKMIDIPTDKLTFNLQFSVNSTIEITGFAMYVSLNYVRNVKIRLICGQNKEIFSKVLTTAYPIMFLNKIFYKNVKYTIKYTFEKVPNIVERIHSECLHSTPWNVNIENVTFTFYENCPHIKKIHFL